ncbi:MAG: DNA polymerase Y family protein [Isosphaeraceae bacterium]|nr:DNA polymerase Y family protein [Isosphaeraceae bacterium]
MKRVLCIHLPAWPLQRLRHERPDLLRHEPVALYDEGAARGPTIVLYGAPEPDRASKGSARPFIAPGMPVAEALAVERRLQLCKYDPEGDVQALRRLSEWANRFSPLVALEDAPFPQSLLLDLSGCAPLFRGERPLLDLAARGLRRQGWKARLAIADTIGAAWALAHHGAARNIAPPGEAEPLLRPLPVEALRLPAETVRCLDALGIAQIGALMDLPRSSVPTRLGPAVLLRLDQALGRAAEVLMPHKPPPEIEAGFAFEYATDRQDVLSYALDLLTDRIHEQLRDRHWSARRLECRLFHEGAEPSQIEVGLARPSRSTDHLRLLLRTRLERVALPAPVSGIDLCVTAAEPLDDPQADLFDEERAAGARALSALIDQLSSRLGREAVTSPKLVADAQPEHACRFEPAISSDVDQEPMIDLTRANDRPNRPVRLCPEPVPIAAVSVVPEGPPIRFDWLGREYRVACSWGPERIETGWWRGRDVRRDYYVVETTAGARFWIFRCRDAGRWYLHGCFD